MKRIASTPAAWRNRERQRGGIASGSVAEMEWNDVDAGSVARLYFIIIMCIHSNNIITVHRDDDDYTNFVEFFD